LRQVRGAVRSTDTRAGLASSHTARLDGVAAFIFSDIRALAGLEVTNESCPRHHPYILIALKAFAYKSLAIDASFSQ
jgi:hypothetical protein